MDGIKVHCARLHFVRHPRINRDFWTEVVAHWATDVLDGGAVIKKQRVPIFAGDTCETLNQRALQAEYRVQIAAIHDLCDGVARPVTEQIVQVRPGEEDILAWAKQQAHEHHKD